MSQDQKATKMMWEVLGLLRLHLQFQTHKGLLSLRDHLAQRLPYQPPKEIPETWVHKVLRSRLGRTLRFRIRKVQLAILAFTDLRVPQVRREWIREYRALQNLPDLRD